MSTEHQQYSTDNQKEAIAQYADQIGCEIVATYEDAGRSGLNIEGRAGLQQLLADVEGGKPGFDIILVYDVSRWGRFQNIDESASYEFRCHLAGVRVEYCAEQFVNDGSIGSDVLKAIKRSMAAEHSRVLSVKVFAGQSRLIGMGYRQGGPPGFGLRRLLIDQHGKHKGILERREHKSLQTDRVILVPGPHEEILIVQGIYRSFVENEKTEAEIALELSGRGILTDLGRAWSRGTVHQVLINEKYIGNNVWNRGSFKLKRLRTRNAPDLWVRADGVFEAIVDRSLFERAQQIILARSERTSDGTMLELLRQLLDRKGSLSGLIIDETTECPSSSAYQARFGSLLRAYQLIGFTPERDYRYIEINRRLRAMHPEVVSGTIQQIEGVGSTTALDPITGVVTINREFTVSIAIVRCTSTPAGSLRWRVRLDQALDPDITIAVRMNPGNTTVRDYLIIPTAEVSGVLRTAEFNDFALDTFLFASLDPLLELAKRVHIKEAA